MAPSTRQLAGPTRESLSRFSTTEAQALVEQAQSALAYHQVERARDLLFQALRDEPGNPMAHTKLAGIALLTWDHALAQRHLANALDSEPNFAPAWYELASTLWQAGQRLAAVDAARRATTIQPYNPHFRMRHVQFAAWTGRTEEARAALQPLLDGGAGDPEVQAVAIGMLGEICVAEAQFSKADRYLQEALRRQPGLQAAQIILGMNRLRLGDFERGWPALGIREAGRELYPDGPPAQFGTWWTGDRLTGRTILIADDQGHGDAIQFFRYLPMVKARGATRITWRTFPPLVRLFADASPDVDVLAGVPPTARFDVHCTSTSLPRLFGTTARRIPAVAPYIMPPPQGQERIELPSDCGLKVGLVWSGDGRHMRDHLRSIPADLFLSLADIPGMHFYSLQHRVREQDVPALVARPTIDRRVERALDMADTAALISGLDLVIAVDTAIAHLAGAMGKPCWVLLHCTADWRWQTKRANSPWYPSLTLFRQRRAEWNRVSKHTVRGASSTRQAEPDDMGWEPLVRRVAVALHTYRDSAVRQEAEEIIRPRERPPHR